MIIPEKIPEGSSTDTNLMLLSAMIISFLLFAIGFSLMPKDKSFNKQNNIKIYKKRGEAL